MHYCYKRNYYLYIFVTLGSIKVTLLPLTMGFDTVTLANICLKRPKGARLM